MKKVNAGKLTRRILAAALGLVVAGSLLWKPSVAADSAKTVVADNRTLNTWDTVNFAQDTKNTGRIWTDKSVSTDTIELRYGATAGTQISKTEGSDFLVALSAMSSTSTLTTTVSKPLDIVLVLDVSGSMEQDVTSYRYTPVYNVRTSSEYYIQLGNTWQRVSYSSYRGNWGYGSSYNRTVVVPMTSADDDTAGSVTFYSRTSSTSTKLAALKDAANAFVASIEELNEAQPENLQHRIGLVKFAHNNSNAVGNNKDSDGYNYSQIVSHLDRYEAARMTSSINALTHGGATRASYGLAHAQTVLAQSRPEAQKVVIFFTDGDPNGYQNFWQSEAANAVNNAKALKDSGAVIFSVGVVTGADVSNEPTGTTIRDSTEIDYFLHAVSSNYPAASATYTGSDSSNNVNAVWTLTPGPRDAAGAYYKAVGDNTSLTDTFDEIFQAITTLPVSPTVTDSGNPQSSGYVTFTDKLGSFMEVKGANAIVYNDQVYTVHNVRTGEDGTTIYEFTQTVTDVNQAHPGSYSLSNLLICVTPGVTPEEGDSVAVLIPAALLPLRHYDIAADGKLTITEAHPVRVLYSVGMKEGVNAAMESGKTDAIQGLTQYVKANSDDEGRISFYSNAWSDPEKGGTVVTFTPASTNGFYYFTEDTQLYVDEDCTQPLTAAPVEGTSYYYKHIHYSNELADPSNTLTHISVSVVHTGGSQYLARNEEGYYILAGTPRYSFSNATGQRLVKPASGPQVGGSEAANVTGSASYALYPTWVSGIVQNYLGNNGRISYVATGSLAIAKTVTADEGLTAPNASFQFDIQLSKSGMDLAGTYATETSTVGSAQIQEGTVTIDGRGAGTVTLQADQTLTIHGLPGGTTYTVKEADLPGGFRQTAATGDSGSITIGDVKTAAFTNHYSVTPVTGDIHFPVSKVVTDGAGNVLDWAGKDWSFNFVISGVTPSAPMPANQQITITRADQELCFGFEDVKFAKPGVYNYTITEVLPTTEDTRIAGINYSKANYRMEVTVTDKGDGTMGVAGRLLWVTRDDNTSLGENTVATKAVFTNTYQLNSVKAGPRAHKVLVDLSGGRQLQAGEFSFSINPVGENADEAPTFSPNVVTNTQSGVVTFGQTEFTQEHVGKVFTYELREVLPQNKEPGMTYAEEFYRIQISVIAVKSASGEDVVSYTAVHYDKDGNVIQSVDAGGNPIVGFMPFTNTYDPTDASLALKVQKTLTGRNWTDSDRFGFTLTALDGAPMPAADSVTVDKTGSASFGAINFNKVGTYKYQITETVPQVTNGITYDTHTALVTVTVTDKGGALVATAAYDNTTALTAEDKAVANAAAFTNTYKAEGVLMTPSTILVNKTLQGREWKTTDDFTFSIWPDGMIPAPSFQEQSIDWAHRNDTIAFDEQNLTYTAAGVYTYYITENAGSLPGITYDRTIYRVQITIADDGLGKLKVADVAYATSTVPENMVMYVANMRALTYTETDLTAANFVNTYQAAEVTLTGDTALHGVKTLIGKDGGSFTFTLTRTDNQAGVSMNGTTATVTNMVDREPQKFTFGDVTFTQPGTYGFAIRETVPAQQEAHMTYDRHVCDVTVVVTDNGNGQLEAVARYADNSHAIFQNIYYNENEAKDVSDGTQTVDGQLVSAGQELTYTIDWANTALDANGKPAAGTVTVVDTIPAGTTLVPGSAGSGVYADGKITWTISAQAAETGTVSFKVKVNSDLEQGAAITNQASVNGVQTNSVTNYIPGKTVSKPATQIQVGDILTYTITYYNTNDSAATVKITDALQSTVDFVSADNGGVYNADSRTVSWTIENADPGEGSVTLQVKVNETALSNDITNQATVDVGHKATTNVITVGKPGTGSLTVSKTVSGTGAPDAVFQFRVDLADLTGSYPYTVTSGATGTVTNGTVLHLRNGESATITGLPLGTEYTVTEVEIPAGFAPDGAAKSGTVTDASAVSFVNAFTPAVLEGATNLKVEKRIVDAQGNVTNWPSGYSFGFRISAAREGENVPMPAVTELTLSGSNRSGSFGNITYTQTGTYNYVITEIRPTDDRLIGINYSHAAYLVEVTVTEQDGALVVSSQMSQINDDNGAAIEPAAALVYPNNVARFNNTYALATATWGPSAQKYVQDLSGANEPLKGGEFTFRVDAAGVFEIDRNLPVMGGSQPAFTGTYTNDAAGDVAFGTVAFEAKHVGSREGRRYVYEISEIKGTAAGWIYTDQVYFAHVTVTKQTVDGVDAVVLSVKYTTDHEGTQIVTDSQGNPVNELPFTNTYDPADATAQIQAQKDLNRDWLQGEAFQFQLTGVSGAPMPEGSSNGTKTISVTDENVISFGTIRYDKVGTYNYEVQELIPAEPTPGLTYDSHVSRITVTVTDENGTLKAQVAYDADGIARFVNTYDNGTVTLPEAKLNVTKELIGRNWLASDSFTFTIAGSKDAPMPASTEITLNNANQAGSFGTIEYTDAGTYTYTVKETKGTIPGITYDTAVYTVTVVVADDLKGNLTIQSVTYQTAGEEVPGLAFQNTYTAADESANIYVNKVLNGRDWQDGETFTFQLTGVGGAPMPATDTIQVGASGTGSFATIHYTQAGTYEYQIRELVPETKAEYMTYDGHTAKVTVRVRDDHLTGKLVVTVSYADGGAAAQFTNVYYNHNDAKSVSDGKTTIDGKTVSAGDVLTYAIKWANTSGGVGTVTVVDQIPAGTTVVSGSGSVKPTQWDPETGTLKWVLSNQPIGATGTITFQVKVREDLAAGAELVNTAQVNNVSTNSVKNFVPGKTVNSREAELGALKTYTITYRNPGSEAAKVIITDTLDENLTFVSAGNGGSYDAETRTITWVVESLAAGEGGSVTFQARLNVLALEDATPNAATVQVGDHKATTNTVTIPKIRTSDLTISKTVELTPDQGTQINTDAVFTFQIQLEDAATQTLSGSYSYTVDGAAAGTIASGDSITLKHGQKAVISGLPAGTTYTVTETAIPGGYSPRQTAISGAVLSAPRAEFVNTYTVTGLTQAVLRATKTLNGPDGTTLAANQFSFSVYTTADCSGTPVAAGTNDASGNVTFSEQTFTAAGTYVFYIQENQDPAAVHMTYDTRIIRATVSILDGGDGKLKLGGVSYSLLDGTAVEPAFVNAYKEDYTVGSFSVEADKVLTGRELAAGEFLFGLYDAQGNLIATGTNNAAGQVRFGSVTYALRTVQPEISDNYPLTVTSENAPAAFIRLSDTAVILTEEELTQVMAAEALELKVLLSGTELTDSDKALIAAAAPDAVLVQGLTVTGTKLVAGAESAVELGSTMKLTLAVEAAENRSYALARIENGQVILLEDLDGSGNGTLTVEDGSFGTWAILYTEAAPAQEAPAEEIPTEEIPAEEAPKAAALTSSVLRRTREIQKQPEIQIPGDWSGEYTFTIRELSDNPLPGITYSDAVYQVKVTVYRDGNNLVASQPAYYRLSADGSATAVTADQVIFQNSYAPESTGTVSLFASKVLTGRALTAGEFTFEVYEGDKLVTTGTNDAAGLVQMDLPGFDATGEYVYTIREKAGNDSTVIYSGESYQVTVKVTDNTVLGKLEASVTYPESGVSFTNRYKTPVDVYLQATKVLTGRSLRDQEFHFQITMNGKQIATASNDAGGNILFAPITFSQEGTYTLVISEIAGSEIGMDYDGTSYSVKVTVTAGADGALVAKLEDAEGITFRNTYTDPTPAKVDLEATKTMSGRKLVEGEFTFQILQNGQILATATNTADGKVVFDSLTFTEEGTYVLQIQEVQGSAERVTYDTTVHTVVVEVTLQPDNTLLAQLQLPEDGLAFRNTYTPPPGTPETGDLSNALWLVLAVMFSGAGAAALLLSRKKKAKA